MSLYERPRPVDVIGVVDYRHAFTYATDTESDDSLYFRRRSIVWLYRHFPSWSEAVAAWKAFAPAAVEANFCWHYIVDKSALLYDPDDASRGFRIYFPRCPP